jgi:hypothetical protein
MTAPHLGLPLCAILLAMPVSSAALQANRSLALEATGDASPEGRAGAVTLSAGCWLEGEVEVVARLTLGSLPRPEGRGTAGAVTPEAALRWMPDQGRWRPVLGLGLGVRLPAIGRATAPTGILLGGLERHLAPGWALAATIGARWVAGEGTGAEAGLGVRLYF